MYSDKGRGGGGDKCPIRSGAAERLVEGVDLARYLICMKTNFPQVTSFKDQTGPCKKRNQYPVILDAFLMIQRYVFPAKVSLKSPFEEGVSKQG